MERAENLIIKTHISLRDTYLSIWSGMKLLLLLLEIL